MARHLLLVFGKAMHGQEDELARWYDLHHIPQMLTIPGFVGGSRFDVAQVRPDTATHHDYAIAYEIESEDLAATMGEVGARVQAGALDLSTLHEPGSQVFYTLRAGQRSRL